MANIRTRLNDDCPQLFDVGVSYFGYYNYKTVDQRISVHDHGSCYEICYLDRGMQPYYIHSEDGEAKSYRLYGGQVFVTRPYERHSTGDFQQMRGSLYWLNIDVQCKNLLGQTGEHVELLKKALGDLDKHIIPVPKAISARLIEAFMLLCHPNEERIFRACQLLSLFILELSAQNRRMNEERCICGSLSAYTIEVISFIEKNLFVPELDVQMIAKHLHYSRSYAMTKFRKEMGMTMYEYILRKKIECACELLENHSIIETAFVLNFSSSQHFSRVFKEHTNMTPRDYILSQKHRE